MVVERLQVFLRQRSTAKTLCTQEHKVTVLSFYAFSDVFNNSTKHEIVGMHLVMCFTKHEIVVMHLVMCLTTVLSTRLSLCI